MADSQRIEDLRRRVQKDPASIAFAQLAEELRRAGNYEEAVDVCRAGLELHPGYLSARVTLGRALIELNDLDTALAELEYVLKSAPENLAAIRGLAEIHHRQGSLALALVQYRAALALARNDPDLQRTVDDLARQVEPPLPPASADGLSFAQVQDEFLQSLSPPPPVAAPPPVAPTPPVITTYNAEPAEHAEREEDISASPASSASIVVPATYEAAITTYNAEPAEHAEKEKDISASSAGSALIVVAAASEAPPEDTAERDHALKLVAALGQWLEAINVVRAQPRP